MGDSSFRGDPLITMILLNVRRRMAIPDGALFLMYLVLFSILRFFLFFVRGNVPVVALGLKNGQWTALAILAIALPWLLRGAAARRHSASAA
jgi:phosphatidylglycerol:prolipoprotein diacylglycerol transferase